MKNNKCLILLSLLLIIPHGIFMYTNYNAIKTDVLGDVSSWATTSQNIFNLALNEKATSMQQIATYVGNSPEIKQLFLTAKKTLQANDNNYEAPEVKKIRQKLYESVKHSWDVMRKRYDVRQLHFHFGPGSRSFLRVHKPEKYGDVMNTVRYTIVDANTLLKPTKGFETGRIDAGIRGVIPVIGEDASTGQPLPIGALEAGTSFSFLLKMLHEKLATNFAVLCSSEHIRKNMWPESIAKTFDESSKVGSYFIEDSTIPSTMTKEFFLHLPPHVNTLRANDVGSIIAIGQKHYQIAHFPLRDYRGNLNPDLPDAGMVLAWQDITPTWKSFTTSVQMNIIVVFISLILLEIILISGWKFGSRQLQQTIDKQTAELEALATRDQLTGILNRRKLEEYFTQEINRHHRYNTLFSVIMFDLDHFKKVNDTWGHDVGDLVLKKVVALTLKHIREIDIFARWGGEEFIILLPQTDIQQAQKLAERLRIAVADTLINDTIAITISLGLAQHNQNETMDEILKRVDQCLYAAKDAGRNQVCKA